MACWYFDCSADSLTSGSNFIKDFDSGLANMFCMFDVFSVVAMKDLERVSFLWCTFAGLRCSTESKVIGFASELDLPAFSKPRF